MNEDEENKEENGAEEPERFSDDPEEQLRIENELLRLQLQAETGADIHQLEDVPPEVEHAFLNNILAFERQLDSMEELSIFKILGEPDFPPADTLDDAAIEKALESLVQLLRSKQIAVDYGMEYPARLQYKFITEELFLHETQQFDIPDMVNHFIYEEFHPNHELAIKGLAEEFLTMWLARKLDEESFVFGESFLSADGNVVSREEFFLKVQHVFDAFLSFEDGSYEITGVTFEDREEEPRGPGYAEGFVRYRAVMESREELQVSAPFKLYVVQSPDYWEIMSVVMPGLAL